MLCLVFGKHKSSSFTHLGVHANHIIRQRGRQGRRGHGGCADVFTIFVDNLPNSVSPKGLYNLFNKFGVVQDVFIPYKRRWTTDTRFGFVTFDCFVAVTVTVKKANRLWVDDKAIEVKHADLGKEKIGGAVSTKPGHIPVKGKNGQQGEGRRWVAVSKDQSDNITLKAEEIGNGWLYESVVVHLNKSYATVNLKKKIETIGVEDVLVRESGGRDVVFTFRSKEEMALKLKPIKELILEWCGNISKGKSGLVLEQERSNSTNAKRIGGLWRHFLYCEGDMN
ncbi:hypothetical protein CsSME_00007349 [Camellia sinensis var. sinensis]